MATSLHPEMRNRMASDSNGVFVVDGGPPFDKDGQSKQRVQIMFVFNIDPIDLAATRYTPTPSRDETGQWLIPLAAQLLLPVSAPQIIPALDAGEALFEMISFEWDSPIVPADHVDEITDLWQSLYAGGRADHPTLQFSLAGIWFPIIPA